MERIKLWIKGSLKSLTMWFNSVLGAAIVFLPDAITQLPMLQAYLPDNIYKTAFVVVVVGNMLLRVKTKDALTEKVRA